MRNLVPIASVLTLSLTAVEIPLSGVVMEFDGRGRRVNK
jgi:hypothetical protein